MALSITEAEYIAAGACCAQILYMKQSLLDYGVVLDRIPLLCDNESAVKQILRYLKHTPSIGLWYPKGASFTLLGYSDSDFAGCRVDRKSTSGGCHLLGCSLVSWSSKKQNFVALSITEAEYIAAGACCAQILYMKQSL